MRVKRSHALGLMALSVLLLALAPACGPKLPEVPDERTAVIQMETVVSVPEGVERLRVWVPLPVEGPFQSVEDLEVKGPGEPRFTRDPIQGNRLAVFYLEDPGEKEVRIDVSFRLTRKERDAMTTAPAKAQSETPVPDPADALDEERLVPSTSMIERLASDIAGNAPDRMAGARRIYDWCVANLRYDRSGEGWGQGDTLWACDSRRGNCTDFHSVFIALARAEGIPARFVMGYSLPPDQESGEVDGYHCWAEFYTLDRGWTPVDASEAARHPEYHEYYFGRLTPDRFAVSIGRDLELSPSQEGDLLNFLYKSYAEADGEPVEEVETKVRFGPA